jgi:hypothetical protein
VTHQSHGQIATCNGIAPGLRVKLDLHLLDFLVPD